jgi:hypothetical protein
VCPVEHLLLLRRADGNLTGLAAVGPGGLEYQPISSVGISGLEFDGLLTP